MSLSEIEPTTQYALMLTQRIAVLNGRVCLYPNRFYTVSGKVLLTIDEEAISYAAPIRTVSY